MLATLMRNVESSVQQYSNQEISIKISQGIDSLFILLNDDTNISNVKKTLLIDDLKIIKNNFEQTTTNSILDISDLKDVAKQLIDFKEKYEFVLMMISGISTILPLFQILTLFIG